MRGLKRKKKTARGPSRAINRHPGRTSPVARLLCTISASSDDVGFYLSIDEKRVGDLPSGGFPDRFDIDNSHEIFVLDVKQIDSETPFLS